MGSTVSTNKRAYAFVTPLNKTAYVLFEETYEKNCYPHKPDWSCVSMGYLEEVLDDLFLFTSNCEGGMLQHGSGHVKPETYLQRWMEALAEPFAMPDVRKTLGYGASFYATIPLSEKGKVEESLRLHGFEHEVANIAGESGRDASLHQDFDLLRAIYQKNSVGAWRYAQYTPHPAEVRKDLGYSASLSKVETLLLPGPMYRCGNEDILLERTDGGFGCAGWAYSVVGSFIRNYVKHELARPGSFRSAFKTYREAARNAPQVGDESKIDINIAEATDEYDRNAAQRVIDLFNAGAQSIQLTLAQVRQKDQAEPKSHALYRLLACRCARWQPMPVSMQIAMDLHPA